VIELIQEALASYNLPLTMLLGLVVFYWLLVIIGAMDFDVDMPDVGDVDTGPDFSDVSSDSSSHHVGGAWLTAGRFLGFSQVPIAVWASFFTLFLWAISIVLNYQFNGVPGDRDTGTATMLLLPGALGSLILTKLAIIPVARMLTAMANASTENVTVLKKIGIVTTTQVTQRYGQLQIDGTGAPVLINVRLREGRTPLSKGDSAIVTESSPDGTYHYVEATQPHPAS
jgi:hypothetical protein